ncbi:MAG TPA: hypothetical protein VLA93_04740 [Pyrinomonadaceae bacterium]|nr:hypothetical protein [Pyrinomonadaceae bacterium]
MEIRRINSDTIGTEESSEPTYKLGFFGSERERHQSFTFLRTSASPVSLRI